MKKEYSRYINSMLKELIPNEFPCFKYVGRKKEFGLNYSFVCKKGDCINVISIQNYHNEDSFMVELFWSKDESMFQNDLTHIWFEDDKDRLKKICDEAGSPVRVRLPIFFMEEFEPWWAIDPTGNIIKSIKQNGYITSESYFKFMSEDSFYEDEVTLKKEEYGLYIDPLIDNVIDLLKKYAIPLFECLNGKSCKMVI